jgi:hypothetical protein
MADIAPPCWLWTLLLILVTFGLAPLVASMVRRLLTKLGVSQQPPSTLWAGLFCGVVGLFSMIGLMEADCRILPLAAQLLLTSGVVLILVTTVRMLASS